jgi:hypothetical protein
MHSYLYLILRILLAVAILFQAKKKYPNNQWLPTVWMLSAFIYPHFAIPIFFLTTIFSMPKSKKASYQINNSESVLCPKCGHEAAAQDPICSNCQNQLTI